ncbi:HNH endonuclease [Pseudocnuella soli]|uniref:HNH endonuclease n=1 Tax=Pseudocnuella soli TaxID=2502779 RepID=UPI0010429BE8|nr:HNH endonuclease [Pseudocnuella soli]
MYGGNRQSGISASASFPYIFIFSGQTGHQHGYKDQWENPDVFSYTGEGQLNDMSFVKGNLELRNHVENGKQVFLFIYVQKGYVRFESELVLNDFDFFVGKDRAGKDRTAIKFFFRRAGANLAYSVRDDIPASLTAEPEAVYKQNIPNETERTGLVVSRVGQGAYRKSILYRWQFKCAVTSYSKKEILIASHIVPWKDANNEERLDVSNGILLSPNYDALFDQHLISFENTGKIIFSDSFAKTNYRTLGITGQEVVKNFSQENKVYLDRHRIQMNSKL